MRGVTLLKAVIASGPALLPRAQCRAGHYPTVQQKFSPRSDSQSIVFSGSHAKSRVDAESVWDEAEGRVS